MRIKELLIDIADFKAALWFAVGRLTDIERNQSLGPGSISGNYLPCPEQERQPRRRDWVENGDWG